MKRHVPKTNRHRSSQKHATPQEFICAVEGRFDLIAMDLAATKNNAKHPNFISPQQNSLRQDWTALLGGKMGYLNPPFDPITPWIDKCVVEAKKGARLVVLSRASVDANWFWKMFPHCAVYALSQRITFVGSTTSYPSPLILSAFNVRPTDLPCRAGRLFLWDWKKDIGEIAE